MTTLREKIEKEFEKRIMGYDFMNCEACPECRSTIDIEKVKSFLLSAIESILKEKAEDIGEMIEQWKKEGRSDCDWQALKEAQDILMKGI